MRRRGWGGNAAPEFRGAKLPELVPIGERASGAGTWAERDPDISGRQTPRTGADRRKSQRRRGWEVMRPRNPGAPNSQNRRRSAKGPLAPGLGRNAVPEYRGAKLPEPVPVGERASGAGAGGNAAPEFRAQNSQNRCRSTKEPAAPGLGGMLPRNYGPKTPRTGADRRRSQRRRGWEATWPRISGAENSQNWRRLKKEPAAPGLSIECVAVKRPHV